MAEAVPLKYTVNGVPGQFSSTDTIPSGNLPFGAAFYYTEDDTTSSTTSSVFQPKIDENTPVLELGDYLIFWSAEMQATNSNRRVEVEALFDGAIINDPDIEPNDVSNWYSVMGVKRVTVTVSEAKNVQIVWRRQGGGGGSLASIRYARYTLWKVY